MTEFKDQYIIFLGQSSLWLPEMTCPATKPKLQLPYDSCHSLFPVSFCRVLFAITACDVSQLSQTKAELVEADCLVM